MALEKPKKPFLSQISVLNKLKDEEFTISACGYWGVIWERHDFISNVISKPVSLKVVSLTSNSSPISIQVKCKASAVAWIPLVTGTEDLHENGVPMLLVGFPDGDIRVMTFDDRCVAAHQLHHSGVECITLSYTAVFGDSSPFQQKQQQQDKLRFVDLDYEVWILFQFGTLVCVPLVRLLSGKLQGPAVHEPDRPPPTWNKWRLSNYSGGRFLVCTPRRIPRLFEDTTRNDAMVLVVGGDPVYSLYIVESQGQGGESVPDLGQLASAVANRLTSAVNTIASRWGVTLSPDASMNENETSHAPSAPLEVVLRHRDSRRIITQVYAAPSKSHVACCDNLGRVSLVEVSSLHIVRMWKGYRQAQCAWLTAPLARAENIRKKPSRYAEFVEKTPQDCPWGVYLVIYAPQRSVVEVWKVPEGVRVEAFRIEGQMATGTEIPKRMKYFQTPSEESTSQWFRASLFQGGEVRHVALNLETLFYEGARQLEKIERGHDGLERTMGKATSPQRDRPSAVVEGASQENVALLTIMKALDNPKTLRNAFETLFSDSKELDPKLVWEVVEDINRLDMTHHLPIEVHNELSKCFERIEDIVLKQLQQKRSQLDSARLVAQKDTLEQSRSAEQLGNLVDKQHVASGTMLVRYFRTRHDLFKLFTLLESQFESSKRILNSRDAPGTATVNHDAIGDGAEVCTAKDFAQRERPSAQMANGTNVVNLICTLKAWNRTIVDWQLPFARFLECFCVPTRQERLAKPAVLLQEASKESNNNVLDIASFLFTPLLADVFAANTLYDVTIQKLQLEPEQVLQLFWDWWFQEDIMLLVMVPFSMSSNPILNWFSKMFPKPKVEGDDGVDANSTKSIEVTTAVVEEWQRRLRNLVSLSHALLLGIIVQQLHMVEHSNKSMDAEWKLLVNRLFLLFQLSCLFKIEPNTVVTVRAAETGDWSLARAIATMELSEETQPGQKEQVFEVLKSHRDSWPFQDCVKAWKVLILGNQFEEVLAGRTQSSASKLLQQLAMEAGKIECARMKSAIVCQLWTHGLRRYCARVLKVTLKAAKCSTATGDGVKYPNTAPLLRYAGSLLQQLLDGIAQDSMESIMAQVGDVPRDIWPPVLDPVTLGLLQPRGKGLIPHPDAIWNHLLVIDVTHWMAHFKLRNISLQALFPRGTVLVTDASLFAAPPPPAQSDPFKQRRKAFVGAVLQASALLLGARGEPRTNQAAPGALSQSQLLDLASRLGVSTVDVRGEYAVAMYWLGRDDLAQPAWGALESGAAILPDLMKVAVYRLHAIVNGMQGSQLFANVLATVSADTIGWVRSEAARQHPPEVAEETPSLSATHSLVVQMDNLSGEGEAVPHKLRKRISEVVALTRILYEKAKILQATQLDH